MTSKMDKIMDTILATKSRRRIAGTAFALAMGYGAFNMATGEFNPMPFLRECFQPRETRSGEYQGFKAEAFKDGELKRVILFPENGIERVIGTDYSPKIDGFESVTTLYLSMDNPLRELATPEHVQNAWDKVWGERK